MIVVLIIAIVIAAAEVFVLFLQSAKVPTSASAWPRVHARGDEGSNSSFLWGTISIFISVFLILVLAVIRDLRWLLIPLGLSGALGLWALVRRTPLYLRAAALLVGVTLLVLIVGFMYKEVEPEIDCSLALLTTIHRMKDPGGSFMRGGQNDLAAVLRVRQKNGLRVRHVSSLRVEGNVSADFSSYVDTFAKGDGTEGMDDLERRYASEKPYFHVSWVIHPDTHERIDLNDEEFIRITISRSMGAIVMPPGEEVGTATKKAFGFYATGEAPRFSLTTPTWSQLIEFSSTSPTDLTGIYPRLRREVKDGEVKISVDMDGEIVAIPVKDISFPWVNSFTNGIQTRWLAQDLFYGVDTSGEINGFPTPRNPLVQKEQF
jgi:hypothetical protein